MATQCGQILLQTSEETDVVDITPLVLRELSKISILDGTVFLFVPGSTGALTTIEFESGVVSDLKKAIDRIAPEDIYYEHNERWGDGNGYAHVRAAIFGPSLHIPVVEGALALGTWQQIILLDFDNRPRKRRVLIQVYG
jgi:secondary thiamine-phosphate synthase enzyme